MQENQKDSNKTIIIHQGASNAIGIVSFIFGLISVFILSPLFVPLALIFGTIGIIKKQMLWSILGIVLAIIGFVTSPILMGMLAAIGLA
ncbi:MAG: hypothetical protein DRG11_02020 [Epsilonproteobacteria bacterium]|nr:MAG: hypothetical protein DRG11_02020 [Campylobacterota bacterium]